MPDLPRPIDYVSIFLDELVAKLGTRVDTHEGSRWDALAGGIAQMAMRVNKVQVDGFDAHTRENAKGTDLDDYCRSGPLRRLPSVASRGEATFARATFAYGATDIEAGHQIRVPFEGRSVVFEVRETTQVLPTALSVSVPIIAITPGADTNVGSVTSGIANIDTLDDTTLLPTAVSVSGGANEELDDELRERQRFYEQSRQRGTRAAIALGALMVNGVKHVVVASRDDQHLGAEGVVYVADRDWVTTDTMIDEVTTSLEGYRGLRALSVRGMTNQDVTITGELEMMQALSAYNTATIRSAALQRILDYFDKRKAPFEYSLTSIAGRMERAHDEVMRATISDPTVSAVNPLSPTTIAISGFPATLTRYRTSAALVSLTIKGPV
jgi:uncharacterized phage protein gp47/JayE